MNKGQVDAYRCKMQTKIEEMTIQNTEQNSNILHIRESLNDIKDLLKEQNGRVRQNEKALSSITAIGGVLSVIFSGFIAWLFKGRL